MLLGYNNQGLFNNTFRVVKASSGKTRVRIRVVKNPGFLKKNQPTRVFWGILKFNLLDRAVFFYCFICNTVTLL